MKLFEISNEVNVEHFKSIIRSLVSNTHRIANIVEDMIERGTDQNSIRRIVASLNARWFSENYPTLKSTALALRGYNKNFEVIASIPVNIYSDGGAAKSTKSNAFKVTQAALKGALSSISSNELYSKYESAVYKVEQLASSLSQPAEPATKVTTDPRRAVVGNQNSQVEMIVNMTIKHLPTDMQRAARNHVNRADNKLVALQQFMTDNKL